MIRFMRPTDVGAFVPFQTEPLQRLQHQFGGAFGFAGLVCIFDSYDEVAAVVSREKPVEDCSSDVADMRLARGAWCESDADPGRHSLLRMVSAYGLIERGRPISRVCRTAGVGTPVADRGHPREPIITMLPRREFYHGGHGSFHRHRPLDSAGASHEPGRGVASCSGVAGTAPPREWFAALLAA